MKKSITKFVIKFKSNQEKEKFQGAPSWQE